MNVSADREAGWSRWPRCLMFGLNNATTIAVLSGVLSTGLTPAALVLPDTAAPHLQPQDRRPCVVVAPPEPALSILTPESANQVVRLAWSAGVPVVVVRDLLDALTVEALRGFTADAGLVACFSRRIPQRVLDLFRLGVLNIHPSLLPAYRGPAPLFWQFRAGETRTGVTVHLMDEGLDTGDILAQETVDLPDGISGKEADRLMTVTGTRLAITSLAKLASGMIEPVPQPSGGSYYGWPAPEDFRLAPEWSAQRAYNFMRGTAEWGELYRIDLYDRTIWLSEAVEIGDRHMTAPLEPVEDREAWIRFGRSALKARLADGQLRSEDRGT